MTTAYVTDTRFAEHDMRGHPEHAGRLIGITRQLEGDQLLKRFARLLAVDADDASLLAVHRDDYLRRLARIAQGHSQVMFGSDTYVLPVSYEIARLAAGAVMRAVDAVMTGEADNGLAAIRPPGHHACPGVGMGFCLLNNVAIAARHAQARYGLDRVLIIDYDVHHGNGTQDIFYADPTVLYVSIHQSPLYPGTGAAGETGVDAGEGFTLNIPLPPGVGDAGYREVMDRIISPVARRFQPDLILVSVGFDAHFMDPLAGMRLSLGGYDWLARAVIALADELCVGRLVFVLEGGYDIDVLGHGWANLGRALLGDAEVIDPSGPWPGAERPVDGLLDAIRRLHKLY